MDYKLLRHYPILFFTILIFISSSCNSPSARMEKVNRNKYSKFDFNKLIGKWNEGSKNNHFVEQWKWDTDSSLVGVAYEIMDNDTIKIDQLIIKDISYYAKFGAAIRNRYMNSYVWFEEVESNRNKIIFKNESGSFPSKISYSIISNTQFKVLIEGEINDVVTYNEFIYNKKYK